MGHHEYMRPASEPPDRVGVLLVPGIAAGRGGGELSVFAEAVLGWLERAGAPQRESNLLKPPQRRVEVRHTRIEPADDRPPQTVLVVDRGADAPLEIVITEAQWPARLQFPAAGKLGRWLVRVLPFLLLDVADTVVLRDVRRFGRRPLYWWRIAAGLLWLFMAAPLAIALVAVVVTTLVLTWLHIPGFDRLGSWLGLQLSRMFGDSYLLTTSPVQADAAVEAVGREIDSMAQRCPAVSVVAVAQGAAVAHTALRRHRSQAMRLLVTVGSGLRKYHEIPAARGTAGRPWEALFIVGFTLFWLAGPIWVGWIVLADPSPGRLIFAGFYAIVHGLMIWAAFQSQYGRPMVVDPMKYALPGAGSAFTWVDYYASADLVACGPVIDPTAEPQPGWPHEITVYNRASWFGDHGSYLANVDGFLGDLIPRLMSPSDGDRPPEPRQAVATARRYWRVQWLVGARVLAVLTGVAALLRVSGNLGAIGAEATGLLPEAVTRLVALAVKAYAELPLPAVSPAGFGLLTVALATVAVYMVLLLAWRRWDRRDAERYLAGAEPDAGGWPFAVFVAAFLVTTLVTVVTVVSLFQPGGPARMLAAALAAVTLPPQLLAAGMLTFLAVALYRGTALPSTHEQPGKGQAWFMLRLLAGALALVAAISIVTPGAVWVDDLVAPTRLAQLPGVLIGGVAGLAVGEAVRKLRYVLAAHVRPWIVQRSVVGASSISWGRIPPRGAALLRTLPFGGPVARLTPDGRHLLTASAGRASLRDTRSGRLVDRFPWTGQLAVADELVAEAAGGTVRVRAIGGPGPWSFAVDAHKPPGEPAANEVTALAFSPDGRLLVSAHAGGKIRVHDVQGQVELWQGETGVRTRHVAVGAGRQVAVAGDGRVQLWSQRDVCWEIRHEWTDDPHPARVTFDAAGTRLAVATADQAVLVRDCASGTEIARMALRGASGELGPIAWHPTGAAVVIAVGEEVRLWHPDDPSRDVRLYPDKGDVLDLDLTRDGQHMVVSCLDFTTVWRWCEELGVTV
jgi:hypothetical protein